MRLLPISIITIFVSALTASPPVVAQDKPVDIQAIESRIQLVLDKVRSCTVGVGNGGSGVVISKEGLILTCAHVARSAGRSIRISFPDGTTAQATTLGNYHTADAGLIRINKPGDFPFAEMAKSNDVSVGEWVLAVGYPVSFLKRQLPPVRIGRVLRSSQNSLISDAPIMGGDSGGPLFSLDGKVIGISSRVSNNIASNVHVPIDQFHRNWKRLLASEDWPEKTSTAGTQRRQQRPQRPERPGSDKPKQPANDPLKALGVELAKTAQGIKVTSVTDGSPAHRNAITVDHYVLQVGDTKITTVNQCRTELAKYVGTTNAVSIKVGRADAAHAKVTIRLKLQDK